MSSEVLSPLIIQCNCTLGLPFSPNTVLKSCESFFCVCVQGPFTLQHFFKCDVFTDCDVNCHKKCEKLMPHLCGVNQKLIVEALTSVRKGRICAFLILSQLGYSKHHLF